MDAINPSRTRCCLKVEPYDSLGAEFSPNVLNSLWKSEIQQTLPVPAHGKFGLGWRAVFAKWPKTRKSTPRSKLALSEKITRCDAHTRKPWHWLALRNRPVRFSRLSRTGLAGIPGPFRPLPGYSELAARPWASSQPPIAFSHFDVVYLNNCFRLARGSESVSQRPPFGVDKAFSARPADPGP